MGNMLGNRKSIGCSLPPTCSVSNEGGFMFAIVFALLMLLSACSSAPPMGPDAARALIDESAAAMGGWGAMGAVKVQQIITVGGDLEPMQAVKPEGEARAINRISQSINQDFENKRNPLI